MIKKFNSKPEDIIAVIGPSIGPCCFSVKEDVENKFIVAGYEDCIIRKNEMDVKIDLWKCCVNQLIQSGVSIKNITLSGNCTCCEQELFFSHRRDKGNTGGMAAFIELI